MKNQLQRKPSIPVFEARAHGSNDRLVSQSGLELNGYDKADLAQQLVSLARRIDNGEIMSTTAMRQHGLKLATAAEKQADIRARNQQVIAAYHNSPDAGSSFQEIGAAIAGELSLTAMRDGFMRNVLALQPVEQGGFPRHRVRQKNIMAAVASGPSMLDVQFVRDPYIMPPEFYVKANVRIEERDLAQGATDLIDNKMDEGREAMMVQEDRTWKQAVDRLVGVANNSVVLAGGLTPNNLGVLREQVNRWNLPVVRIAAANDILNDITGTNFGSWFDPVSQLEVVMSGTIGKIIGIELTTDAYREPNLRVFTRGDIYVLSSPEFHGGYTTRGDMQSNPVDSYPDGVPARGWFIYELISMAVHNPRSFVKGTRA